MQHSDRAKIFNKDEPRVNWHDQALWFVRQKRDKAAQAVDDWETLRESASYIKAHVLSNLDEYLMQFEENAIKNGVNVHWAEDAGQHNEIVFKILKEKKATHLVKSKSMLTEECGLNPFLEAKGIEVTDTDLGEHIVQLAKEPPSHIVLPAIHKKKEDVDILFNKHLGTKLSHGNAEYLTREARKHLRKKFFEADAALTGVNFAVAETGGIVVCTNEGNADMGVNTAPVHIASMGIEKIIPKLKHLGIFLRLLARSATGQPITSYSSHFHKPRPGCEMHIIIVDNGRSIQLGRNDSRNSLHCIRCGACMNTCPVFRRSGGHSYGSIIPGPIGSVLSPGMDMQKFASLPFASSLCASCSDVCPVKIDLHGMLYKWRQVIKTKMDVPLKEKLPLRYIRRLFLNPEKYRKATKIFRICMKILPGFIFNNPLNPWARGRKMPDAVQYTFYEWYQKNRK